MPSSESQVKRQTLIPAGGPPWWRSGEEYTCQCRGHSSNPCSQKIPQAKRQLSPCAWSLCSPTREATHGKWRVAPTHRNKRKPVSSNEHPAQPNTHTHKIPTGGFGKASHTEPSRERWHLPGTFSQSSLHTCWLWHSKS